MMGANRAVAKYCAELKMAEAVPRSLAGNQAATMRPLAGNDGASAKPTRRRSANRAVTATAPAPRTPTAALEQGEERPDEDAPEINGLGAEAVEHPAARDLRGHIGPAERGEDVTHLHGR